MASEEQGPHYIRFDTQGKFINTYRIGDVSFHTIWNVKNKIDWEKRSLCLSS